MFSFFLANMFFNLFKKKNRELLADLEIFLSIKELDSLLSFYNLLEKKYGIIKIQKYFNNQKFDLFDEQQKANILFYPAFLPEDIRLNIQKNALDNRYGEYALLAAVVGLQGKPLSDEDIKFFINRILQFLYAISEYQRKDVFSLTIASRMLNTFLLFDIKLRSHDIYKTVALLINDVDFKVLHHNLLLILCKYQINLSENNEIKQAIGIENYNKAMQIFSIMQKDKQALNNEERSIIGQLYSPIPSFSNLIIA